MKLSKHFTREELQCHCCKECHIEKELLLLLEKIRTLVGTQVFVNSGYRCEKHNAEVGGNKNSWHTKGMAADIRQNKFTNDTFWSMVRRAWASGLLPELGGLGRYNGRIHVDTHHASDGHLREWDSR